MSEEFLTVSEVGNFIKDVLRSGFPQSLWVCGEIQEIREKNNHLYFTLSEKDPASNQIIAKIGSTIWANARPKIDAVLKKAENAFVLKDDIEVKLLCKVDFYPPFGQIRLIVEGIDPIYTLGKIAQDRQRLIAALKQKGILDKNKQLVLSRVPLNIGLVTSYDSAAYHDFIDELKRSGFGFKVYVIDAVMQGKNAQSSVVGALKVLNSMGQLDAIVITRGGGSIADLSCFDSEAIAVAIAHSALPVLSGIGHEINTSVTDLAAHTFAKTPTAVARFLIAKVEDYLSYLKDSAHVIQNGTRTLLKKHQDEIARLMEAFKRAPQGLVKSSRQSLLQKRDELKRTIHLHLANSRSKIENYNKLIEMADPKNILKRGFSITRDQEGKVVRTVKEAAKAKTLVTALSDGQVSSEFCDIL